MAVDDEADERRNTADRRVQERRRVDRDDLSLEQRIAELERLVDQGRGGLRVLIWIGGFVAFVVSVLTIWTSTRGGGDLP